MSRYDLIILGTGPAGISAAITATIRKKSLLLIGASPVSAKVQKAHEVLNYPGLPAIKGDDFARALQNHLDAMQIPVTEDQVSMVYPMGDYFAVQTGKGFYESRALILATGVVTGKPYPGEDAYLGRGVSYCATCDAALYKNKKVAVIGASSREEKEADFLTEYASEVLYFPLYRETPAVKDKVTVIREVPAEIIGGQFVTALRTNEREYTVDGIFILRNSIAPDKLVPGLELEDGHVKVDRQLVTNLPGLFACGDITGRPYQYVKAAGEGNVAALSAVEYLSNL